MNSIEISNLDNTVLDLKLMFGELVKYFGIDLEDKKLFEPFRGCEYHHPATFCDQDVSRH